MAKRYLDVSYDDRELAKRLGARWDPSVRRWYCPSGSPLAKIFKWRAEAKMAENVIEDAQSNFASHPAPNVARARKAQPRIAQNENFELFLAS